jgi:hypothetical protein
VGSRPERLTPLTSTDQYLAAILDELRTIRGQLAQEPADGQVYDQVLNERGPRLVSEPAPERRP